MKQRKYNLIIAIILLILLLAIFFVLISMPAAKDDNNMNESQVLENIIDIQDKKISCITVKNSLGSYEIKLKTKDDKDEYLLSKEDDNKTSQKTTQMLVESIINLKPIQIVQEDAKDLSLYGVDKSQASIKVDFDNNDTIILKLGNDAPLSKGAYLVVDGESKVYLISTSDKEIFLNEKDFYKEQE